MKRTQRRRIRGFSLVELMVVIAIIAVLIALLVPGVNIVIGNVKSAAIKLEVSGMAKALEQYKLKYGEYPPDFTSGDPLAEINVHLVRNFRYRNAQMDVPQIDLRTLDPMEALYFWLRGFSPDPQRPLSGLGDRSPMFDFEQPRFTDRDGDGHLEYVPQKAGDIPYVYYRHQTYASATVWAESFSSSSNFRVPKPYLSEVKSQSQALANAENSDTPVTFVESDKFQIISAGLDAEYGMGGGWYPGGTGYTDEERDNITNFIQGGTLEDDIP